MIEYSQSISESSGTSLLLIGLRNIALVLLSALDKDGLLLHQNLSWHTRALPQVQASEAEGEMVTPRTLA